MKNFTVKNGLNVNLCLIQKEQNGKNFFVVAVHNGKQVGFCNFEFHEDECRLIRIAVTNKNFLSKGVGNIMFKTMENFAFENGIKYLSGIFIPRGYANAWDLTAKFYQRQKMTSSNFDYDYCDRDDISKNITEANQEFSIKPVVDEKLYSKVQKYNYETNDIFSSNSKNENVDLEF